MVEKDESVQHCELTDRVNIFTTLEAAEIDHLGVDNHRIIVIYQRVIFMVVVTAEGQPQHKQSTSNSGIPRPTIPIGIPTNSSPRSLLNW